MPLLTLGDATFADVDALADHMEARGVRGIGERPGQAHPGQWYLDRLPDDPREREAASRALWRAAAVLLRRAEDPEALSIAWAVCGGCLEPAFFDALLDRLERDGARMPASLRDAFASTLPSHFPASHSRIGARVRRYLAAAGLHGHRVEVLLAADPEFELLDALALAAASGQLSEAVARRVASKLSRGKRRALLEAARRIAPAARATREAFRDKVAARAKDWFAANGRALEEALTL